MSGDLPSPGLGAGRAESCGERHGGDSYRKGCGRAGRVWDIDCEDPDE